MATRRTRPGRGGGIMGGYKPKPKGPGKKVGSRPGAPAGGKVGGRPKRPKGPVKGGDVVPIGGPKKGGPRKGGPKMGGKPPAGGRRAGTPGAKSKMVRARKAVNRGRRVASARRR